MYYQHLCIAGPYVLSHDLARKNAKFTVKLSATCHAVLGRCGESRRQHTYCDCLFLRAKLIYMYNV